MVGLLLGGCIGFLLGILLMIFLVSGREEEELLDRVERAEFRRASSPRASDTEGESVFRNGKGAPHDDV